MGLKSRKSGSGKEFTPAPDGNHRAVCIGIYDLGTHPAIYEGKPKLDKNGNQIKQEKVIFTWELVDEAMDDGRPFLVSREFTNSLHEKSGFRPFLNSWLGTPLPPDCVEFDIPTLLDKACMLNVVHRTSKDGKVYANAASASPIPKKGVQQPTAANDSKLVDLDEGVIPPDTPKWIANKMRESIEFKAGKIEDLTPASDDEEEQAKKLDPSKLPASASTFNPTEFNECEAPRASA